MPNIAFECAFGQLDVRLFHVRETISQPFDAHIVAMSQDMNLALDACLGQRASLRFTTGFGLERSIDGICCAAERERSVATGEGEAGLSTYSFRLVPKLWLLTQRRGHRIFQHLSTPEIIDKLLAERDITASWRIDGDQYPKYEYRCQYAESDFVFMSRLLEEAGLGFTLANEAGGTELIISDRFPLHPLRPDAIRFEEEPAHPAPGEYVTDLRLVHEVRAGAMVMADHDFRRPTFRLVGEAPLAAPPDAKNELYDFLPGDFLVEGGQGGDTPVADDKGVARHEAAHGKRRATRALEAERGGRRAVRFATNVADLAPGIVCKFDRAHGDQFEVPVLVTGKQSSGSNDGEWSLTGDGVFVDDPYRPPFTAPKQRVYGVQSARVVGPPGEEIYVDEFGRVRVQFPWDREGGFNDDSSCWMRVSEGWAGASYGMIHLPRVGQEVLVAFLDGDADSPIVVGRVFNALERVPYKLPENKTVSGWKSCSSPDNGGYNEYKIEDRADQELIYERAQRDRHTLVRRDEVARVERDQRSTVLENQHLRVGKTKKELIGEDEHVHVKRDRFHQIDGSMSLTVRGERRETATGSLGLAADEHMDVAAGEEMVLRAGQRLSIRGPGGFIDIHDGGIDIVGKVINLNSGGSAARGRDPEPVEPSDAEEALPKDVPVE